MVIESIGGDRRHPHTRIACLSWSGQNQYQNTRVALIITNKESWLLWCGEWSVFMARPGISTFDFHAIYYYYYSIGVFGWLLTNWLVLLAGCYWMKELTVQVDSLKENKLLFEWDRDQVAFEVGAADRQREGDGERGKAIIWKWE